MATIRSLPLRWVRLVTDDHSPSDWTARRGAIMPASSDVPANGRRACGLFHGDGIVRERSTLEYTSMAMFDLSLGELRKYRPVLKSPDFDDFWRDTID